MPSDSEFMMTAEEIRLKRLRRRRFIVAAIVVLVILVAGIFGGRPSRNAVKAWQARRHANKAFAYIDKENWTDARKEATAAYQLRPTEPQSVRAVARLLSRMRQPDALEFWQQLEKIAPLTREDRQDEAAVAITAGETTRAETAVHALLESKDVDPASWLLAAQLSIQKGVADEAMAALRKVFSDPRTTEQQQLQAALLELSLASGTDPADERLADAWSRIEKISEGQSAVALPALALLARRTLSVQRPEVTSQKSEDKDQRSEKLITDNREPITSERELAQRLASHPLARAPQKLLSLDLLEHATPSRHDELIAQGIAQWKDGDADDLLALAKWLNGKNEFQKTLDTIPLEKTLLSGDLFLQYLDALGGLGRWSEIEQLLDSERYPLDPVVQKMYLARCNAQLGEKTAADNNWQRALELAGGDVGKLISLAEYAEKNGIVDVAQSAFSAAATEAPKLRPAQQGRLRIAQRSGDTKNIHAILAEMLKIWPNDAAVQNDEAYTRLLLMGAQQSSQRSETSDQRAEGNNSRNDEAPAFAGLRRGERMSKDENEKKENAEHPTPNAERRASAEKTLNSQLSTLNEILELAANLVVKNPRSMPHRTLLALVYLKQNRPADALVVYKDITVTRSALTPSALAVHAAVLAANGQTEEARSEVSQLRTDQLLPEERALAEKIGQHH
jgi:thioredoxin-like negative regulator of GroEL